MQYPSLSILLLQVCRHFIQAIEDYKYGWFWTCPNGGDKCMYKHALPPGFVLKRDKKKMSDQAAEYDEISMEELVEEEVWTSADVE